MEAAGISERRTRTRMSGGAGAGRASFRASLLALPVIVNYSARTLIDARGTACSGRKSEAALASEREV
jgi:hypothetical protein